MYCAPSAYALLFPKYKVCSPLFVFSAVEMLLMPSGPKLLQSILWEVFTDR